MTKATDDACQSIYVAANAQQAHLLAGTLEEEGIHAVVGNSALQNCLGGVPPGFGTAPNVLVREADAARARALALQLEGQLRESSRAATPVRPWYQFSIRALLFVTVGAAIYFGVDQAVARGAGGPDHGAALAAVYLFAAFAFVLAFYRQRRAERNSAGDV